MCLVILQGVSAQVDGEVEVQGVVTNHSSTGGLPIGDPVTLQFFEEGNWTSIYTGTIQSDGSFIFKDLGTEVGNDFVTRVMYGDVEYFSEPAILQGKVDVDILIYEPTDDGLQIQVDQAHFFIVPTGETVQVAEYYLIGNGDDRTYIGGIDAATNVRATVYFEPPKDAINLTYDGPGLGERFVGDEQRFADTRPIPPGNATIEVSFVYDLNQTDNHVIERTMEIPIASVVFIVSGGEVGLEGPGLEFSGIMDTQMGPAASYTAGPLAAFEVLSFSLSPLMEDESLPPATDAPEEPSVRQRNAGTETGIGVVAIVGAVLIAYQIWQAPTRLSMPEDARGLIHQMVDLDRQLEEAGIDKAAFKTQRAALKRRIWTILSKQ